MPTTITPLGTPPQRGQDEQTFANNGDILLGQLPTMVSQINTVVGEIDAAKIAATTAASTATTKASEASGSAATATTAASTATTKAGEASTSATNAATSASQAAVSASGLTATSTSSVSIGVGTKTFNVGTGKSFVPNIPVMVVSAVDATQYMTGTVNSYSGGSLSLNVTDISGSGTYANWNVSIVGVKTTGVSGNLTGAINELKGADVASASTPNIWSGAGNYEVITGTATITGFTNAPQAGARRRLLAAAAFSVVSGSNLVIKGIPDGQTYICSAGDEIDVYAETSTKFRLTVHRADGMAMASLYGTFQNTLRFTSTTTFTARKTGWHRITVVGSGGRGGLAQGRANYTVQCFATGGGGGGFSVGMRFLIAGNTYTVIVGSPYTATSVSTFNTALNGVSGNSSSFSGSGVNTITANGGGGGQALVRGYDNNTSVSLAGGVGGPASGGDLNVQGGSGGSINISGFNVSDGDPPYTCAVSTGGGSVSIQGTGFSGGSISYTTLVIATAHQNLATGGAGVGGNGGPLTNTTGTTGGGGSGGASGSGSVQSNVGKNFEGVSGGPSSPALGTFYEANGGGGFNPTLVGPSGGGGCATVSASAIPTGGALAGAGAISGISVTSALTAAYSLVGGGGGAVAHGYGSTTDVPAATTGGVIQIEW